MVFYGDLVVNKNGQRVVSRWRMVWCVKEGAGVFLWLICLEVVDRAG